MSSDAPAGASQYAHSLRQAEKLEILGTLARGIAHDFNNQLTVILGNIGLALEYFESEHPAHDGLLEAQQAAQTCAEANKGLLTFSRTLQPEMKRLVPDQLLDNTVQLLRRVIPTRIAVHFEKAPRLHPILADATQIQQVIMNLAVNARNAMPKAGVLELRAENGEGFLHVYVSDFPAGKLPDIRKRIFGPLSAAMASQGGAWFGLAASLEIVKSHGGQIDVTQVTKAGTSFRILLPFTQRAADSPSEKQAEPPIAPQCILVAEDESLVRRATVKILERRGYRCLEVCDGEEAVRVFEDNADSVDLVFLDFDLPKVSGLEALQQIRAIRPDVKVMVASGYELDAPAHFLPKPYAPEDLIRTIREIIPSR